MIYLDNAATTLRKPEQVISAVAQAMNMMGNSSRGTHECGLNASRAIYETREKTARFFGCARADHVVFTNNSTEALNIAINGVFNQGDHVITTDMEHNSVLRPLYRLESQNQISLSFVPADKEGNINYSDFEKLINANTKAIICTHASNLTGSLVDIEKVGSIAKKHSLLFIVDASQTAGCFKIDMKKMHIDILCFTGHKSMLGPQGIGGMCIAEGVHIRPFKVGGTGVQTYSKSQPNQLPTLLEAGTLNGHGIAGLSAAIDYINSVGIDKINEQDQMLAKRFYEGVSKINGVKIYGDFSVRHRAAVVAINIYDYDSGAVSDELSQRYGIATRPGAHCAPRMHQSLGTTQQGAVRFSFSWFSTIEEVDSAIQAVKELANEG